MIRNFSGIIVVPVLLDFLGVYHIHDIVMLCMAERENFGKQKLKFVKIK